MVRYDLRRLRGLNPRHIDWLTVAELALLGLIAFALADLFWTLVRPYGPIGPWRPASASVAPVDRGVLTRFDPFFRLTGSTTGATVVTSLPLKLFGTRIDTAAGRGSAIIGTPDGIQSSFAVGDEIVPGVRLKSVAFDSVTVERGGTAEQLFLDQSKPADVAQPTAPVAPGGPVPPTALTPQVLRSTFLFTPRVVNGKPSGMTIAPKGDGVAFRAAGFQPGDVLTMVNGQAIASNDEAAAAYAKTPVGGTVNFTIERGGVALTLSTKAVM